MIFHVIGMWLLVASIPLWAIRWYFFSTLSTREQQVFRRLVSRRHENPFAFAFRMFGFLLALATAVILLVVSLRYLKYGALQIGSFREALRSRLYSGVDGIDQALDTLHYDQLLPVAVATTCALLAVSFTLVSTALRDITMIRRLSRKTERLQASEA